MRSVEEQLSAVTAAAAMPEPVRLDISSALGLMCAEDVVSEIQTPAFSQAAIDGFAVRAVDVTGDFAKRAELRDGDADGESGEGRPRAARAPELPVVGEVPAGSGQSFRLQPNQAVRVYTGAPLPILADAVLPLDWVERTGAAIRPDKPVSSGDFVRRPGDDVQVGDIVVSAGQVISPAQIGLLASVGRAKVLVHPRPRVSVMSIGQELVDITATPQPGQIHDVNSYSLAAAARDAGADVSRVGIAGGEPAQIRDQLQEQLRRSEVLVIAGAVGGDAGREFRSVLNELGDIDYNRVAMHPGSVQGFGLLGEDKIPTFLLTGNPIGALVAFEVMVRPLIRIGLGKRNPKRRTVTARCMSNLDSVEGRRGFIRARLMRDRDTNDYLVQPLSGNDGRQTHLLAGFSEANCLIVIGEDDPGVRTGDPVDVLFLSRVA